jgi:hypothetical protein
MDGNANGNGHGNASRAFGQRRPSVREAARGYLARGWRVIPLKAREKTPEFKSWTTLRIAPVSVDTYFLPTSNIGILTGSLTGAASGSGNGNGEAGWSRIDVDLDTPEAIAAAAVFLPPTGLVHGRPSKPASHYWYLVEGPVETAKFALPVGNRGLERPAHNAEGLKPPEDAAHAGPSGPMDCAPVIHGREAAPRGSAMFVELRAGGCQTMAPPSIHPCGELLRWEPGATLAHPGIAR